MKPIFFIDRGTFKEIIRDDKSLFKCVYCGEWFRALAYHTTQKHGITAKQLRKDLNLKATYQLITNDIKKRHRELALSSAEGEKLKLSGKHNRYIKGHKGHIKRFCSAQALQ
jgi:predicted transcriptional regulator